MAETIKEADLRCATFVTQSDGLKRDIFIRGLRLGRGGRVEGADLASDPGHDLLEAPVVSDAERVDETLVVDDVRVDLVEADELLAVEGAAVAQPFAPDHLADRADGLQRLTCHLKF